MSDPDLGAIPEDYFSGGGRLSTRELARILNTHGLTIRSVHKETIAADPSRSAPGQAPTAYEIGTTLGLHFDTTAKTANRTLKIQTVFAGAGDGSGASFHVHWTKRNDADANGDTVRWKVAYTVWAGQGSEIALATPTILTFDDAYVEATADGSRHTQRTANIPTPGFVPGYYVGVRVYYDPVGTTLTGGPVLLSCDCIMAEYVNRSSTP